MAKRLWWKGALVLLAAGSMFAAGGCYNEWIQRILIDSLFDSFPCVLCGQVS